MCSILLSINPKHVKNIMNGRKIYEFRKRACKRHVDKIIIYSTTPVMKIVGEAEVADVLIDEPDEIWKATHQKAGIDRCFFDDYFADRNQAVAYKLKNIIKYEEPKELGELGIKSAPQSFQYIDV